MTDTTRLLNDATPVAFLYGGDRQRVLDYYCDTLGFTLRSSDPNGDFIDMGDALIRLTIFPDYKASPYPVLGWNVADIEATARALGGKGIAFVRYDFLEQDDLGIWTSPDGHGKVAWFNDIEGNLLSIAQA